MRVFRKLRERRARRWRRERRDWWKEQRTLAREESYVYRLSSLAMWDQPNRKPRTYRIPPGIVPKGRW